MRFMAIMKATKSSEAGVQPTADQMAAMIQFHEEAAKSGMLLEAEGVHPSSKGARVRFSGTKRTVIDGPFAETKELIAGYWIIQAGSKEEAIEWVKRMANVWGEDTEIEIRQVAEAAEMDAMTPELEARIARMHADAAAR